MQVATSSFAFNAFELCEATDNHPLSVLGFFLIKVCFLGSLLSVLLHRACLSLPVWTKFRPFGLLFEAHLSMWRSTLKAGHHEASLNINAFNTVHS